jgi:phospholipase/lecithinase/hemolysin
METLAHSFHRLRTWKGVVVALIVLVWGTFLASASTNNSLIIFGDSLSDVGNAYQAGNTALVPPNYVAGEYTDGTTTTPKSAISGLWIEQLAALGGLPKPTASSASGFDYAFAGAVTATTGSTSNPGLGDQVTQFLHTYPSAPSGSLYVIWGGGNDLNNAGSAAALPAAETSAISNLKGEISQLAAAGAKNFLWLNLPPLGDTPAGVASGYASQLNASSAQFKQDWSTAMTQLKAQYPSINLVGLDVYSNALQVVASPSTYGFTNVTSPAQSQLVNPDAYVFWDQLHPTTKAGQVLAEAAFQALTPSFFVATSDSPTLPPWAMVALAVLLVLAGFRLFPIWQEQRTK